MSWLFVVLIPGLLMMATVGLQRVESALGRETVTADDVAEYLEHAKATSTGPCRAHDADGPALRFLPRVPMRVADFDEFVEDRPNDQVHALPAPRYVVPAVVPAPKTEFQQTRHADRV